MDENDIRLEQWKIDVEKRLSSGDEKFNSILSTLQEIKEGQKDTNEKIDSLQQAPGQNWKMGVNAFLSAVIAAVVGFFVAKIH